MKRLSLLIVMLLVSAVMLGACGGGGSSPSATVKTWNEAVAAQDVAKAKSVTCAASQPLVDFAVEMFKAAGAKTDVSGFKYEESNVTATSASVRYYGKVKVDIAGAVTEEDSDQTVDVIKEGNNWVVCPKTPTP
jgi:ABC-type glycerol-3-phosphate transport system substrate-binding protein